MFPQIQRCHTHFTLQSKHDIVKFYIWLLYHKFQRIYLCIYKIYVLC